MVSSLGKTRINLLIPVIVSIVFLKKLYISLYKKSNHLWIIFLREPNLGQKTKKSIKSHRTFIDITESTNFQPKFIFIILLCCLLIHTHKRRRSMNIFSIISTGFVAMGTSYSIFLVYRNKNKLNNTPGILISMVIAVITGLLSGSIIGIVTGETFLTVGISMIIGFVVGFLAGHPVGILAILMGAIAGLMGGINGAILGLFLQYINPTILLGILLGFYVVIIGFVIVYIHVATNAQFSINTEELSPFAIISGGIVLISLFLFMYSSDMVKIPGKNESVQTEAASRQEAAATEVNVTGERAPTVKILVTDKGYSPNVIIVKKGVTVKLEITNPLDSSNCLSTFMIPYFNMNHINLKTGTTNLSFTPDKTGEYSFSCGMKMFKGKIIVE